MNRAIKRIVAAIVGVASVAFPMTSVRAQSQRSPLPIALGHFVLVLPQGEVPYRVALGLPVAADSRTDPRMSVPRVVTLIAPASEASETTRDWLDSIAFPSDPQTLLLLQVNSQGVLVRQYALRNVVPIHWSIVAGPNEKLAIETLVLYCASGVQIQAN